jgi:hypothetical protein
MEDDAARIKNWARVFYNPETLAWILMANAWGKHAALMVNVKDINSDMGKNDFEDMGEQTAQLLVNALGPVATL